MYNIEELKKFLNENLLEGSLKYDQIYEIGYSVSQNRFNSFRVREDTYIEDINKIMSATKIWQWKMMEYNSEKIEISNVKIVLDKVIDNHGNVFLITKEN